MTIKVVVALVVAEAKVGEEEAIVAVGLVICPIMLLATTLIHTCLLPAIKSIKPLMRLREDSNL
jgi:hypothetical protein